MFQTCPKHRQDPFFFNTLAFAAGILQDDHGVSFPLLKVGPEKVGGLARVTVSNRDGVWSHVQGDLRIVCQNTVFLDGLQPANSWFPFPS